MGLQLPAAFANSYQEFASYPENVVHKSTYIGGLRRYRIRLDEVQSKLFTAKDANINVPFRDLQPSGNAFDRQKIRDDNELKVWLGDESASNPGKLATKSDPKCRFIFIYSRHSQAQLNISRKMFTRILSYHQVMPSYLDFVSLFGSHSHFREPRFSGFRDQIMLTKDPKLKVDNLGRSGRGFQICWNLKSPSRWSEEGTLQPGPEKWSIRQGAFHHQFDVEKGTALWIVTKSGLDIKDRIQDVTGKSGNEEDRKFSTPEECLKSSFAVLLLIGHWATESWRQYYQWMENKIDEETFLLVYDAQGSGKNKHIYSSTNLQKAQELEEQTNEATLALQGNADVLTSLKSFYRTLSEKDDFPLKDSCSSDISGFLQQIDSFVYDSNMQVARGKLLTQIVAARKTIILQHLQSQATEKMESLTRSMQRDSTTVRIIGTMTFLYLPGTFVSTFFSTDVVKYQSQDVAGDKTNMATYNGSYSAIAMHRWLQVSLPLTFLTFAGAFLWFWIVNRRTQILQSLPTTQPKLQ